MIEYDLKQVHAFKQDLQKKNLKGLALDIDETLSSTNNHWFEHMFKFHKLEGITIEEAIKRYKYVEEVPEWRVPETLEHMQQTVHSNEFNENLPIIEGADKTVREIDKLVPIIAYITARPVTVVDGTRKWLDNHKFPKAEIITRPEIVEYDDFNLHKNRWKAQALAILYPEVLGIVDDNVVLAHELERLDYKGRLFLYGSESEEFKNHKFVSVCSNWQSVLENIKKDFNF